MNDQASVHLVNGNIENYNQTQVHAKPQTHTHTYMHEI